jgi:molybdate transport system regulatory protein
MNDESGAKLHIRIITAQKIVLGWGRADLLGLIAETGSIAAAGRRMGMSYKRAWALVETMNDGFAGPLVTAAKGGAGGGGAQLTALGLDVLAAYREIEALAGKAAAGPLARIAGHLKPDE